MLRQYPHYQSITEQHNYHRLDFEDKKTIMSNPATKQTSIEAHLPIGWIGLGSMGLAMAINIQKHLKASDLPNLHYWNRTISRGQDLQANNGEPREDSADVCRKCGVTFISVSHAHTHTQQRHVLTLE